MSAQLAKRQGWLLDAITADAAPARIAAVLGGAAVAADLGLEVYRHAYRARLRECIADDYAAVRHALGAEAFDRLADGYIAEVPPHAPTLNSYGADFRGWLRRQPPVPGHPHAHLCQLADLEWALVEAVHAPRGAALGLAALQKLPASGWATARLVAAPSLRLVRCTWAVNAAYEAWRAERPAPAAERWAGSIAVLRRANGLRRIPLAPDAAGLLRSLRRGMPLAAALAGVDPASAGAVQGWFAAWVREGFFTGIATGG